MYAVRYIEVTSEETSQRLDNYLLRQLKGVPKSHIYRIIRSGEVRVNSKRAIASLRICAGDIIRIPPVRVSDAPVLHVSTSLQQQLLQHIIYEDDTLLVVNKPSGLASHGGSGLSLGLIEALRKIRSDIPYLELVHRLDKDTSGCILLAKKRSMLRLLQELLAKHAMQKVYWLIGQGTWQGTTNVVINAPLQKNILKSGERMVVVDDRGKNAETRFKLLTNYRDACFIEACPKTGRTHQIRVHSAMLQHNILGDQKYTSDMQMPISGERLYLHARSLKFNLNGHSYYFEAELDDKFSSMLKYLGTFTK